MAGRPFQFARGFDPSPAILVTDGKSARLMDGVMIERLSPAYS